MFHTSLPDVGKDLSLLNQSGHIIGERSWVDSHLILWYVIFFLHVLLLGSLIPFAGLEYQNDHVTYSWSGQGDLHIQFARD